MTRCPNSRSSEGEVGGAGAEMGRMNPSAIRSGPTSGAPNAGRERPSHESDPDREEKGESQGSPEHGVGHRGGDLAGARDGAHQPRVREDPPELGERGREGKGAERRGAQRAGGEQREDGEGQQEVGPGARDHPENRGPGLLHEIGRRTLRREAVERVVELAGGSGNSRSPAVAGSCNHECMQSAAVAV
jgi:hypothetical protein